MNSHINIRDEIIFSLRVPFVRFSLMLFFVTLLLLISVVVFYWWPAKDSLESTNASIELKNQEILKAALNEDIAKTSNQAAKQIALIESKLDASSTQASLVKDLADLARKNNVKIISESYEEAKSVDGYTPLTHALTVQAEYSQLRRFISDLQDLSSFTIVREANIARSKDDSALKAQLHLITYQRSENQQRR
jgi:Tfp pilus assembly protein PilO